LESLLIFQNPNHIQQTTHTYLLRLKSNFAILILDHNASLSRKKCMFNHNLVDNLKGEKEVIYKKMAEIDIRSACSVIDVPNQSHPGVRFSP